MADYSSVTMQGNSGTDASPVWTTTISFGGSGGANEWRWASTGLGGAGIASAAWPNVIKPASTQTVGELWACTGDSTCVKMNYAGDNTHPQMGRFSFTNDGAPASQMALSAFQDTADTTPSPGTQVANSTNGQNIINGQTTDTSNTSYLKGNVFGSGMPVSTQETPATATGAFGGTPTVTSGSAGALTPAAAAWNTSWQSFQGWIQYCQGTTTNHSGGNAYYWYWALIMYVGPQMQTGNMIFCPLTLQYTWT